MGKSAKKILMRICAAINILIVIALVIVGYSPYVNPSAHPNISYIGIAFPVVLVANILCLILWVCFKIKMAIIPIIGLAIVYSPIKKYCPLNLSKTVPGGAIKVMSYNVKTFTNQHTQQHSREEILEYVETQQPDILCTQEATSDGYDILKEQTSLFPYSDIAGLEDKGNATLLTIHSRYPILGHEDIPYETTFNRSTAFYLLIDGDTTVVINNHLESSHLSTTQRANYTDIISGNSQGDDTSLETQRIYTQLAYSARIRSKQADAVNDFIERHKHLPIILCGDFNDTPISYTHRTISEHLTDCFIETGNGLGISFNLKGFVVRIDHIMCSDHFTPYGCFVDSDNDISDHYPMICWLKRE